MGLLKELEQRTDDRDSRFAAEYSLTLSATDNSGRTLRVRPIDVSRRGLGFLAKEPLKVGTIFNLMIGQRRFRVEMAYCNSHLGIDGLYRCGLFLRDADGSLHGACHEAGLLADNNLRSKVTP